MKDMFLFIPNLCYTVLTNLPFLISLIPSILIHLLCRFICLFRTQKDFTRTHSELLMHAFPHASLKIHKIPTKDNYLLTTF